MKAKKILILRFSAIGDIVLTTPVLRSLKKAHPDWEIHYFTKPGYKDILLHNPHVDHIHTLEAQLRPQLAALRKENFDFILDLHHNLRTLRIKLALGLPSASVDKQNIQKYRLVRFKQKHIRIPHIVQRYGETLQHLGLELDAGGLEFHLPEEKEEWAQNRILEAAQNREKSDWIAVVLGATFATKRWIPDSLVKVLRRLNRPVLLIGGKDSLREGEQIMQKLPDSIPLLNAVGRYDLLGAAALMKQCQEVITHDTGFMHIAAAFGMKVHSIWGNTVPELGMTPYQTPHTLIEQKGLSCRPCSKIGFDRCPKGHFRCMQDITPDQVLQAMEQPL